MILYIVCLCLSACFAFAFLTFNGKISKALCGYFKAAATLILAVPAYRAFAVSQYVVFLLIGVGITLCAVADYIIHFKFIPGAVVFAAAHCVFAPAFIIYGSRLPYAIGAFVIFSLLCAFALARIELEPQLRFPATMYAAVIGVMFSFAFGAATYGESFGITVLISAAAFVASDAILVAGLEKPQSRKRDIILMTLYYLANAGFSLACSL